MLQFFGSEAMADLPLDNLPHAVPGKGPGHRDGQLLAPMAWDYRQLLGSCCSLVGRVVICAGNISQPESARGFPQEFRPQNGFRDMVHMASKCSRGLELRAHI